MTVKPPATKQRSVNHLRLAKMGRATSTENTYKETRNPLSRVSNRSVLHPLTSVGPVLLISNHFFEIL